jgi:hypothetical protein
MNSKGYGRTQSWPNLKYYPGTCLGLRKTIKTISQDSQSPGPGLNLGPSECRISYFATWTYTHNMMHSQQISYSSQVTDKTVLKF